TAKELVELFNNPNIWWRMTAQRLLLERQDKKAVPYLEALCKNGKSPESRVHALRTLEALNALKDKQIEEGLADKNPAVREHAVQLAESRLSNSPAIGSHVIASATDTNARVRFQCALSLGAMTGSADAHREAAGNGSGKGAAPTEGDIIVAL